MHNYCTCIYMYIYMWHRCTGVLRIFWHLHFLSSVCSALLAAFQSRNCFSSKQHCQKSRDRPQVRTSVPKLLPWKYNGPSLHVLCFYKKASQNLYEINSLHRWVCVVHFFPPPMLWSSYGMVRVLTSRSSSSRSSRSRSRSRSRSWRSRK